MPLDFSKLNGIPVNDFTDPDIDPEEEFYTVEPPELPTAPAAAPDSSTVDDFTIVSCSAREESHKLMQQLLDGILEGQKPEALLLLAVKALALTSGNRELTDQIQEELLWIYGNQTQPPEAIVAELQRTSKQLRARIRALERLTESATKPMSTALKRVESLEAQLRGGGL